MRMVFALVIACAACGGKDEPATGTVSSAPVEAATTIEDIALSWAHAALGGRRSEALALSLTYEQFSGLSNKELSKAEFDAELADVLDGLGREGGENPKAKVVAVKLLERRTLPPGEKLKRSVDIAVVKMVIELDGQRREMGMPTFFLRTDAGWRFSPKK